LKASSRHRPLADFTKQRYQLIHLPWTENPFGSSGAHIGERRLIEKGWIHDALISQVIDDQIYKLNLIRSQCLSRQESGKGVLGSFAVQSD
jgi:hypothetical protein